MIRICKEAKCLSVLDTDVLMDKTLSLGAKGLYAAIMNHRGEKPDISNLCEYCSNDAKVVDSALDELVEHGYVEIN